MGGHISGGFSSLMVGVTLVVASLASWWGGDHISGDFSSLMVDCHISGGISSLMVGWGVIH